MKYSIIMKNNIVMMILSILLSIILLIQVLRINTIKIKTQSLTKTNNILECFESTLEDNSSKCGSYNTCKSSDIDSLKTKIELLSNKIDNMDNTVSTMKIETNANTDYINEIKKTVSDIQKDTRSGGK